MDEPRKAVEQANELVEQVIQRLTMFLRASASKLEKSGGRAKTSAPRISAKALRRYRVVLRPPPVSLRLHGVNVVSKDPFAAICRQPPIRIDWLIPPPPPPQSPCGARVWPVLSKPCSFDDIDDLLVSCDREFAL